MSVLPEQTQTPAPSATQDAKPENMIPKSRLDEVIAQRDAAQKKADALETAQQAAEKKRLEESNQYKELYEKAQAELTSLTPKAKQVDEYENTLQGVLQSQVAELPTEFQDIVPSGLSTKEKLDWLKEHKHKFMKAEPFDIGAGKRGTKADKKIELTPEEKEMAAKYGMNEEAYAKYKKE